MHSAVLHVAELSIYFFRRPTSRRRAIGFKRRAKTGVTFDGRGNEVEGNKEVIELAVYIALRTRTPCELP